MKKIILQTLIVFIFPNVSNLIFGGFMQTLLNAGINLASVNGEASYNYYEAKTVRVELYETAREAKVVNGEIVAPARVVLAGDLNLYQAALQAAIDSNIRQ